MTEPTLDPKLEGTPAAPRASMTTSGVHTFGSSVAMLVIGFATSIVIARAAGPPGRGGYDLSIATVGLLAAGIGFALPSGFTYVVARGGSAWRGLLARLAWISLGQGAVALALLYVISLTPVSSAFLASGTGTALVIPLALMFTLSMLTGLVRAVFMGRQMFIAANVRDVAGRVMTLVLITAVAIAFRVSGQAVPTLVLVLIAIASAAFLLLLFTSGLPSDGLGGGGGIAMREVFSFAVPAYGAQLAQFLNLRLDLFLVGLFLTVTDVGWYSLGVSLAQMLWLLSTSAAVVLFPRVASSSDHSSRGAEAAVVCRLVLSATVIGAVVLGAVSPVLVPLLYGSRFAPSVAPLLLLLPGITIFSIANVLGSYVTGVGRPGHVLAVSLVGLAVTVPLDLLLIPTAGILGAAIASSASYAAASVVMLAVFTRHAKVRAWDALVPRRSDLAVLRAIAKRPS